MYFAITRYNEYVNIAGLDSNLPLFHHTDLAISKDSTKGSKHSITPSFRHHCKKELAFFSGFNNCTKSFKT